MASLAECQDLRRCASQQLTLALPSAFAESTSLELPPHGLRETISRTKYSRLHGVRLTTAYPRIALITSLSRRSAVPLTNNYPSHRLHHKLVLSSTFALRLQHALSHCASLELTPHAASSTLTLLTSGHLRTVFIISTFTLRLAATYFRAYITHVNALAHCLNHRHLHLSLIHI